jgi:hypothetical protein
LTQAKERLSSELADRPSKEHQVTAITELSQRVFEILPQLSYEQRCLIVRQLAEHVIVREREIEIQVIVPGVMGRGPVENVVLRDHPDTNCLTNQQLTQIFKPLSDPLRVVRITLFASLPKK